MKRKTIPNAFWKGKAGMAEYNGTLRFIYPKEWATTLMAFNCTVPLYDAVMEPETVEEAYVMDIRDLKRRVEALEKEMQNT